VSFVSAFLAMLAIGAAAPPAPRPKTWQPSPGHVQLPLWPNGVPDALPDPEPESLGPPPGREWWPRANHVHTPTLTVYKPAAHDTGAAALVLPGGGFQFLAMDVEGTEVCDWLIAQGITCLLLKYRVPDSGPTSHDGHRYNPPIPTALQDAQRAIGLARLHADEWTIDPKRIGVVGFSAGGYLAALMGMEFGRRAYPPQDAADAKSARPDFAIVAYPGHLWIHEDEDESERETTDLRLHPNLHVRADAPPTFIVQAADDEVDSVQQSLALFSALRKAGVPTEMHIFATGSHAFGVRKLGKASDGWTDIAMAWLGRIGMTERSRR